MNASSLSTSFAINVFPPKVTPVNGFGADTGDLALHCHARLTLTDNPILSPA